MASDVILYPQANFILSLFTYFKCIYNALLIKRIMIHRNDNKKFIISIIYINNLNLVYFQITFAVICL